MHLTILYLFSNDLCKVLHDALALFVILFSSVICVQGWINKETLIWLLYYLLWSLLIELILLKNQPVSFDSPGRLFYLHLLVLYRYVLSRPHVFCVGSSTCHVSSKPIAPSTADRSHLQRQASKCNQRSCLHSIILPTD